MVNVKTRLTIEQAVIHLTRSQEPRNQAQAKILAIALGEAERGNELALSLLMLELLLELDHG